MREGKQSKCVNFALLFTQLLNLHKVNSAEPCLPGAALVAPVPLRCLSEMQFFFFVPSKYRGSSFSCPSLAENCEMRLCCLSASLVCSHRKRRVDRVSLCTSGYLSLTARVWAEIYTHTGENYKMSGCVYCMFHSLKSVGKHNFFAVPQCFAIND